MDVQGESHPSQSENVLVPVKPHPAVTLELLLGLALGPMFCADATPANSSARIDTKILIIARTR